MAGRFSYDDAICGKWSGSRYKCWTFLSLADGVMGLGRHVYGVSPGDNTAI